MSEFDVKYSLKYRKRPKNFGDRLRFLFVESDKVYELDEPILYELSDGNLIFIPIGFETDLRSVPPIFAWLVSPAPCNLFAYIVHDFLYKTDYRRIELGDKKAKEFADKEMLLIAKKIKKRPDNKISYLAVKYFGNKVFKKWNNDKK